MPEHIIDENLPGDINIWSSDRFIQINDIPDCSTDSHIWRHAIDNNLTILTKDTDFYHRYLAAINTSKVVWFKIGNMKKLELENFIATVWKDIERLLKNKYF